MKLSTPAAPAISYEQLLPSLGQYCFSERMVRALQREPGFVGLEFRSHAICFVQNFSPREANQKLPINHLSRAFRCPPSRVKTVLANWLEPTKVRGRHLAIDEGLEAGILEWIEAQTGKCDPITRTHLRR
jgi:hypothetical protein